VLIFGDLDHLGGTKDVDASARDDARRRGDGRLLVNGVNQPDMEIVAGQAERWRLVNAARGQLLRLSLSGAPLTLVGAGCGPVGEPVQVDQVLMAPGQRLDLVVGPLEAGQTIALQHRPRGPRRGAPREASLATLHVLPGPRRDANTGLDLRRFARDVAALANFDSPPTRTIQLGSNVALRCPATSVPGSSHFFDDPVQVGQLQVWDLCNPTDENHVFHLYGFFFQVLQINGTGPPFRSWNDTVSVPARGRVRIAWRADRRPGGWTYHFQSLERPGAITTASFQVT
jgi:FtsP/CotA-like multicopper oxidase with cupredoxin domain